MKQNNKTTTIIKTTIIKTAIVKTIQELSLFFAIALFTTSLFSADMLVVASFKNGDVFYKRGEKELAVTKGQIFEKKDKIITKNGIVDLQVGVNSIIRVGKNSSLSLIELFEDKGKLKVEMNLDSGSLLSKVTKKLDKNSDYKITTPTKTAGVRGTQFLIQEGEDTEKQKEIIEDGIYVSEGTVEVKADNSDKPIAVNAGQELLTSQKELKIQILDSFAKEKMKILDTLNVMNETNYKNLQEQYQKNKDLMKK
jgi:FecR protein